MQNQRADLAKVLQGVLEGTVSLQTALDEAHSYGEPMKHCFHGLQHFLADADIRNGDPSYKAMQVAEMHKLIHILRTNGDVASLRAINFLGPSP